MQNFGNCILVTSRIPTNPANVEPGQTSPKPDLTTPEAQEEKLRRKDLHGPTYFAFLAEANKRNLQRHDLATRNKIWDQDMAKARKRIEDMEMERAQLVKNIEGMEKAKGAYNEEMIVEMSRDEDMEVKETWERFFNLGSDQLPTWD